MSEVTHAYVARSECGCLSAMVADVPSQRPQVAKDIAGFVRRGDTVTRVTLDEARAAAAEMGCQHKPKWKKSSRVEPGI